MDVAIAEAAAPAPGGATDEARPDLVTVSEAARRLGIDKSTVSRQVRKFGLVDPVTGRFDFAQYLSLRDAGAVNPLMARTTFGLPAKFAAGGLATAAIEHKSLQAELLRLDLERERGTLVERAAVEEQLATAARRLRDRLLAVRNQVAAELGLAPDAPAVRAIDKHVRAALAQLEEELRTGIDADDPVEETAA